MRRLAGLLASFLVLGLVALLAFNAVSTWLEPAPIVITTQDGRPIARVTQPLVAPWIGAMDKSGYDVSFPQCKPALPTATVGFAIVGLNYGKPFSQNPCFAKQWDWAQSYDGVAVYINVADPGKGSATKYGSRIAGDTVKRLRKLGVASDTPVWLALGNYRTNAAGVADAALACERATFGDALPSLVQFTTKVHGHFVDHNVMCAANPAGLVKQTR